MTDFVASPGSESLRKNDENRFMQTYIGTVNFGAIIYSLQSGISFSFAPKSRSSLSSNTRIITQSTADIIALNTTAEVKYRFAFLLPLPFETP